MSQPLSVCHAVLSMNLGGLERLVLELVRDARERGQQVSVLCLEEPGRLAPDVEALGGRVVCTHKPPGIRLGQIPQVRKVLRQLRPDVVHSHQIGALFYVGPAARWAGVPVVHTEHGKHYAGQPKAQRMARLSARWTRRFIGVSADIVREAVACGVVPESKTLVIPNGIDTARFHPRSPDADRRRALGIPPGARVIGTIGRLAEIKRQDVLIAAFAGLADRFPEVHLLLVGDGPLEADLRALTAGLGLAERVHFAGYESQPERALWQMDVFALTSRSEGMPVSILEAWAAGVPIVASNVGGIPELITDGQTGRLVPALDVSAATEALAGLLADPDQARSLAAAGSALVESSYSLTRMADSYQEQYRAVLRR